MAKSGQTTIVHSIRARSKSEMRPIALRDESGALIALLIFGKFQHMKVGGGMSESEAQPEFWDFKVKLLTQHRKLDKNIRRLLIDYNHGGQQ